MMGVPRLRPLSTGLDSLFRRSALFVGFRCEGCGAYNAPRFFPRDCDWCGRQERPPPEVR